jgi:hypothetical protein
MDRKYNLKLDLQFRCNNQTMKFNQFDNNTSDFFMRITNAGKLVDVEKAIVVLAAIKPSGKVSSQFVDVENGLVYADLKNSMKDEIGTYTAQAMLILEDERVVTDLINYEVEEDKIFALLNDTVEATEDFTLLTDMLNRLSIIEISEEQRMINEAERILSEENRKIEEVKRVEAELVRQHEEADRAKYDAIRESNENIRKQNESIRLSNETNRIDEEAKRVEEENKRKLAEEERNANYDFMTEDEDRRRSEANAHKEAEALRVQAETNRVNEEAKRRTTEQARVSAENTRVSNENTREANEVARQNNETQRVEAETQRQNRYNSFILDAEANASNFENYTNNAKVKEEERKSNELDRKSQEDRRVSNENERVSSENTRKANEETREENETSRQNVFENKVSEFNEKIVELNTTKDNFISSVNTKVDTKISELDKSKSDMTTTVSNKINDVETRFNRLTSSQQQDAEVIDARDGETSLKARLDRDIEKAKQVYVNVEGSHISTDSNVGYAKDVEILGNTIQSASNFADIRSVGDKVEGQELYEIPVVSCGKNLAKDISDAKGNDNDKHWIVIDNGDGSYKVSGDGNGAHGFALKLNVEVTPNTTYTFSFKVDGAYPTLRTPIYVYKGFNTLWDSNKLFHSGSICTFTTPSDTNKICLGFYYRSTADTTSVIISDIQLEEDTQATPYEPYVEDKLTILSPVQLEKVGDVADKIICKDGVWGVEKNIKTKYLKDMPMRDNTEEATHYRLGNYSDTFPMRCDTILCNNYMVATSASTESTQTQIMAFKHSNTRIEIRLAIQKSDVPDITTINELVSRVKNGDTYIKYQLVEPQFIPLPHDQQIKLRTFANKTNISFGCEIEGMIKAQVPKSLGATVNTHTEQISNLNKELDRVKKLEESTVSTVTTESDFTTVEATTRGYFEDVKLDGKTLVVNSDNEVVESGTDGAMLKSVGEDVDEIVVSSNNNQPKQIKTTDDNSITTTIDNPNYQSDKKRLLYYNEETQAWEKPILRQWDSIEKHADGKYYYHQRSGEVVLNGSESWVVGPNDDNYIALYTQTFTNRKLGRLGIVSDKFNTVFSLKKECIFGEQDNPSLYINILKSKLSTQDVQGFKQWLQANNVTVVYQLAQEKVYECTNIDLITYANETNYIVESGAIEPRTTLKVHNNISNVVSLLQKKVSLLESNITKYMITQNRLMLASRYNADTVSFKVDVSSFSDTFEYDNDLYELILNNILVGKDNYNREYIENLIIFYWMDFVISDEMYSTLFEIIEEQHNPKIEEEAPLI